MPDPRDADVLDQCERAFLDPDYTSDYPVGRCRVCGWPVYSQSATYDCYGVRHNTCIPPEDEDG